MTSFDDEKFPRNLTQEQAASIVEHALAKFGDSEVGDELHMPMNIIRPSQEDDGERNYSKSAINVYLGEEEILSEDGQKTGKTRPVLRIDTGNHRFFTRLLEGEKETNVQKVKNPYQEW